MAETSCYLLGAGSRPLALRQGDVLTIGRDQQNALFLDDALASRWHASISCHGPDEVTITDHNSTNRTFVNGSPIAPKVNVPLKNGDQIRIGGKLISFISESGDVEPRKAALKSTKQLTQMDTVESGLQIKDGKLIYESPDGHVESKTIAIPQQPQAAPVAGPEPALSGQLTEQNVPQILQFLFQNQKTGELRIQTARLSGLMAFLDGNIEFAEAGSLEGIHAIYACSRQTNGSFRFNATAIPDRPKNVDQPMMEIIFQCCKRMDEEQRDRG